MLNLSNRNQLLIGVVLVLLLVATRGQHFASLHNLPGATWAVFFLAGVYLRPLGVLPAMLVFVWGLDLMPHVLSGISLMEVLNGNQAFCLTPAYFFLLPAYSALWLAGQWYARHYRFEWRTLMSLAVALVVGASICELFSSGGFYFFSGHFNDTNFVEFGARLVKYFPGYLQSLTFYIGVATVIHLIFGLISTSNNMRKIPKVS